MAGELLVAAYVANFGLDATCLRFFSVYGPRQRPDMALYRMIEAAIGKTSFPLYGDGSSVRDFTYVADVAEACLLTASTDLRPGTVLNVAGGSLASIADLLETVGPIVGEPVPVERRRAQFGDVAFTCGATDRARGRPRLEAGGTPPRRRASTGSVASRSPSHARLTQTPKPTTGRRQKWARR